MQPIDPNEAHVDRSVITVSHLGDPDPDDEYWANATPEDRLRHMELLRRINYGRRATGRIERVLSVVRRKSDV